MKILQLSYRLPYPPVDGGAIGILNLAKAYSSLNHELTLLCFNTRKHYVPVDSLPSTFLPDCKLIAVDIDTSVRPFAAFLNLFTGESYHVKRFIADDMKNRLIETLHNNTFDLVHIDGIFMCPYIDIIRKYSKAKIVLRTHNIEHEIWEQLAANSSGLKKFYLQLLALRLRRFELQQFNRVDVVAAITEHDRQAVLTYGCNKPVKVLPAGINIEEYKVQDTAETNSFFHIGAMDWQPNQEGVYWLLENVWQQVVEKYPSLTLCLAGRNMPADFVHKKFKNVKNLGEVNDAKKFMQQYNIMLVPLLSGGGMRIKIIEGMALGKCIISTTIGAQGIDCKDGEHILLANTPAEFMAAIDKIMNQPELALQIGAAARKFAAINFDNVNLMNNFLQEVNS